MNRFTTQALCAALLLMAGGTAVWFWPVDDDAVAWQPPRSDPDDVPTRDITADLQPLPVAETTGVRAFVIDAGGTVHASLTDGRLVNVAPRTARVQELGRFDPPISDLAFAPKGGLYATDHDGRFRHISGANIVRRLASRVQGRSPGALSAVVQTPRAGPTYLAEVTHRIGRRGLRRMGVLGTAEGQLLRYDAANGLSPTGIEALVQPYALAMSPSGRTLLVAEAGRFRVHRYRLEPEGVVADGLLIDNLPGTPDALAVSRRGRTWITMSRMRTDHGDALMADPVARLRSVRFSWLLPDRSSPASGALALDRAGMPLIRIAFADPSRRVIAARESGRWLYVGFDAPPGLARVPLATLFDGEPLPRNTSRAMTRAAR